MKDWTLKTWAMSREDADRTVSVLKYDGYTVEEVRKGKYITIYAKITGGGR